MIDFNLTAGIMLLLFSTGLAAGFVDSIAGGGGLIALPMLLAVGLPPQVALGVNKLQGTFGTFSASFNFVQKRQVSVKACGFGIFMTLVGAVLGAWMVQRLDPQFLSWLAPILLFLVLLYTVFSRGVGDVERSPKVGRRVFFVLFGPVLGFYDGFFGPGAGAFWTSGCCLFLGCSLTHAAGVTRVMNFTSNIVSLALFILGGNVLFSVGLCMAAGQILGARIGSGLAIKNGARFIRPIFTAVAAFTIARLVYAGFSP